MYDRIFSEIEREVSMTVVMRCADKANLIGVSRFQDLLLRNIYPRIFSMKREVKVDFCCNHVAICAVLLMQVIAFIRGNISSPKQNPGRV